jgi:hypothetical protein
MLGRVSTGLKLGAIILFWLIAWAPMAAICGVVFAIKGPLQPRQA